MANLPVTFEISDGIGFLTLNNPERLNPLSVEVLRFLKEYLGQIKVYPNVKVVVLRSRGTVFSCGHDLNELVGGDEESYAGIFAACTEVMEAIRLLPQPVIAQVQGLATAAGCQLVASCDLAVASETASFATPGVRIGLFCTTPGVAVSRQEALEFGLINRVTAPDKLEDEVMALARQISAASSRTPEVGKQAFYKQVEMDRPGAYEFAQGVMVDNLLDRDAQEGITAFLEKREPKWSG